MELNLSEVEHLISIDNIYVMSEETVLEAVLRNDAIDKLGFPY